MSSAAEEHFRAGFGLAYRSAQFESYLEQDTDTLASAVEYAKTETIRTEWSFYTHMQSNMFDSLTQALYLPMWAGSPELKADGCRVRRQLFDILIENGLGQWWTTHDPAGYDSALSDAIARRLSEGVDALFAIRDPHSHDQPFRLSARDSAGEYSALILSLEWLADRVVRGDADGGDADDDADDEAKTTQWIMQMIERATPAYLNAIARVRVRAPNEGVWLGGDSDRAPPYELVNALKLAVRKVRPVILTELLAQPGISVDLIDPLNPQSDAEPLLLSLPPDDTSDGANAVRRILTDLEAAQVAYYRALPAMVRSVLDGTTLIPVVITIVTCYADRIPRATQLFRFDRAPKRDLPPAAASASTAVEYPYPTALPSRPESQQPATPTATPTPTAVERTAFAAGFRLAHHSAIFRAFLSARRSCRPASISRGHTTSSRIGRLVMPGGCGFMRRIRTISRQKLG